MFCVRAFSIRSIDRQAESLPSYMISQLQYVLSKAGVMEESVNRELNITRS